MFWLLIGILVVSLVYLILIRPLQHWKRLGVPQDTLGNLLVASLSRILAWESVTEVFEKLYNQFPDRRYTGMYQFFSPFILLKDPELIKQITVKDFDFFTNHTDLLPNNVEETWQKNLFNLNGNAWRDMRATLSPAFTSKKLKTIYPLIIDCAKQFVNYFGQQKESVITIDIKEVFAKFTNDIIATTAFGITVNSLEDPTNEFYMMGREVSNFNNFFRNFKLIILFTMPRIAIPLGITFFDLKIVDFFRKIIKQNIKSRESKGIIRSDMIQLLLQAKHDRADNEEVDETDKDEFSAIKEQLAQHGKVKKVKLTDEDIVAQAFLFFFAGFESVSSVMAFMAYELAVNPDVQERLYQEIKANLEEQDGTEPKYESVLTLKYLDMVISETLRKYPGAPAIERQCVKAYTIQPVRKDEVPVHIKVGESVAFATIGLHKDPKLFPNPDRFDPERFSAENKSSIISGSYLPFGFGPRACIGNRFALMEIKVLFYYLLTEFEVVVVEKTPIPLRFSKSQISLTMEVGSCVGLKKRT